MSFFNSNAFPGSAPPSQYPQYMAHPQHPQMMNSQAQYIQQMQLQQLHHQQQMAMSSMSGQMPLEVPDSGNMGSMPHPRQHQLSPDGRFMPYGAPQDLSPAGHSPFPPPPSVSPSNRASPFNPQAQQHNRQVSGHINQPQPQFQRQQPALTPSHAQNQPPSNQKQMGIPQSPQKKQTTPVASAPLKAASVTSSPEIQQRDSERVDLLLDINRELLQCAVKLQIEGNASRSAKSSTSPKEEGKEDKDGLLSAQNQGKRNDDRTQKAGAEYNECMIRIKVNLQYLMHTAQASQSADANKTGGMNPVSPSILTPPPGIASLVEPYKRLAALFPESRMKNAQQQAAAMQRAVQ